MKPYFRKKGYYKDGRERVIIEWRVGSARTRSKALPKPEKLLKILDRLKNDKISKGEMDISFGDSKLK